MLGNRSDKTPLHPQFSMDALRKLIVPDFAALGDEAVQTLASAYDAYAKETLPPLPQMDAAVCGA